MEISTVGSVRDKHDFTVRIIPVVGFGDIQITTRVPPAMSREAAGVLPRWRRCLLKLTPSFATKERKVMLLSL